LIVVAVTLLALGPVLGTQLVRFTQALLLAVPTLR
jgi:type III secretory pathway component EscS